jgi:hypothetical protein
MNQAQLKIISRMTALQRLYTKSQKCSPVVLFDVDRNHLDDVESDVLVARIQQDYEEDISEEVKKGIALGAIVVVTLESGAVSVHAINKPHKNDRTRTSQSSGRRKRRR